MEKEIKVKVIYKNERMEPTYERTYALKEYTDMLRQDLLRLITDVEDMVYTINGNKQKSDWSDESWMAFCKVKHKLLDKAGDIGRLSDNIVKDDD